MQGNISKINDRCFGCRSCEQICPKKCIDIKPDCEGFLFPMVDETLCIQCGLCVKACPAENETNHRNIPKDMYALKNNDETAIMKSASGGASDVIAKQVIASGGIVFGAAYDENLKVIHIEVDNKIDLIKIQSSKYVQSDIGDCYSRAKKYLDSGREVLFSGTPCQISGLYSFLGREYDNLFTLDLICHGVPSPLFFQKYIDYVGKKMGGKVIEYNFRSKEKRGWGTQYCAKTKTKTKTNILALSKYGKHFMDGDCYRESCYQCPFACMERVGDLTIGDFWAVNKYKPDFFSSKGISSVAVNSEKGDILLKKVSTKAILEKISYDAFISKQNNLKKPTLRDPKRDSVYIDIEKDGFVNGIKVGLQLKNRVKLLIPTQIVRFIKKYM